MKVQGQVRITKCGDAMVRALLYEAADVMMTRCRAENWLKSWALKVARRHGNRKAKVALARRLAVLMYRMWGDGTNFSMERPMAMNH
jgi:transposase